MFDGKLHSRNIFGFISFCLVFFLIQNLTYVMMWTAELAGLNVGIVTVIFAAVPALLAIAEYYVFGTKPRIAHAFGIVAVIACSVLLAVSNLGKVKKDSG